MARHEMPDDVRAAIEDDGIDPDTGELLDQSPTDDDAPEPDESDPENAPPAAPQPEPLTEAKAEAIFSALDRYKAIVGREVERRADVLFADLEPCPLCMGGGPAPGFYFPQLPEPDNSMRRLVVAQALGGDGQPDYPDDPDAEKCDRCQGHGKTRTGSLAPGQETRPCTKCNGQGWAQKMAPVPAWTPPAPTGSQVVPLMPQPFGNGGGDPWGRPVGHPHYGQSPAMIGV